MYEIDSLLLCRLKLCLTRTWMDFSSTFNWC